MISLKKTLEAIKNSVSTLNTSLSQLSDYSTSEKAVGKWIDGRTIYRKVYTSTIPSSPGWTSIVDISSLSLRECIRLWGIFTGSDGRIMHTNWCDTGSGGTTQYNCVLSVNGNYIQVGRGSSGAWGGRSVTIIIEYTKN